MKTIFLDIDGTIFYQSDRCDEVYRTQPGLIKGSAKKCWQWHQKGYNIILTTGRPESSRKWCEQALAHHNIVYDQLIMSLKPWPRYLINNDRWRPSDQRDDLTAFANTIPTNHGISDLDI